MVFVPQPEHEAFPWDILINSSVTRFVDHLCLRTTLVPDRWYARSHHYPRVVEAFPTPADPVDNPATLGDIAVELRQLAERVAKRSQAVDEAIQGAPEKALSLFGLDFTYWQGDTDEGAGIRLVQENGRWVLRLYVDGQASFMYLEGSYELLNVVRYLVEAKGGAITARELQELPVPEDPSGISALIDNACNPESPDIRRFKELHLEADEIIAQAFGLNKGEFAYIQRRLSTPPLDVLQPRWPWVSAERREIQEYATDRFA